MRHYIKAVIFFSLVYFSFEGKSQPYLVGLKDNPAIKGFLKTHPGYMNKAKSSSDTINLPFFDDFSKPGIFPDSALWLDKYVYINDSYGENPPSIGVATLDILDESGDIYSTGNAFSFVADYLTSKPIDLNFHPSDSIYLSFFYQPQGKAYNGPEAKDSLVLEFKSPLLASWKSVWRAEGAPDQPFKQVMVRIKDTIFLKKGFQFRFKNYGSFAGDLGYESWRSNGDIWNIDWVRLDTSRSKKDTVIDDVGFVYGGKSYLKNYESIPWAHYKYVTGQLVDTFSMIYKNNGYVTRNIQRFVRHFNAKGVADTTFDLGSENVDSLELVDYTKAYSYNLFPYDSTRDSAVFLIKSFIIWDTVAIHKPFRWNDTTRYYQRFYNYYAYDDGTPETGFCINSSENAMLAYKYYTYKPDTLRAVQIFFNNTFNNASQQYFFLTVWDYKNGKPNDIIYSKIGLRPVYQGINQFYNYLLDSVVVVSDTFFVGWVQTTTDCLNAGFDLSKNTMNKLYYNISGSWEQSPFEGSLMMRAVFGKTIPAGISDNKLITGNISIFPNPATDILNIVSLNNERFSVQIFNLEGQLIMRTDLVGTENRINVSSLKCGMYILKTISKEGIYQEKMVKY